MQSLMEQTGETANLAVRQHAEVVFIGQVETQNPVRALFPSGARTAMHASGIGKAILADLSEDAVRKLLSASGLVRFTDNTHVTPGDLFDDLRDIRLRGWSHDREERYEGMSCIGATIFDASGAPVAGVSISGPTIRFDPSRLSEFGAAVSAAAAEITQRYGGVNPRRRSA